MRQWIVHAMHSENCTGARVPQGLLAADIVIIAIICYKLVDRPRGEGLDSSIVDYSYIGQGAISLA